MKRIDVNDKKGGNRRDPWAPWGLAGMMWRWLVMLAVVFCFVALIASLKDCSHSDGHDADYDEYLREYPDAVEIPPYEVEPGSPLEEIINSPDGDTPFDGNINDPGEWLPLPDDNRMIDVPDDELVPSPENPYKQVVSTRLNVILDSRSGDDAFRNFSRQFKSLYSSDAYSINYYNRITKMLQLTVPAERCEYVHDNLNSQIPDVDFKIFYEEIFAQSAGQHNDPAFADKKKSWYFEPIQAYRAWEVTKGDPSVVVAVIDNYIDVTHPELKDRITQPYSVERQSRNVLPPAGAPYSFDDRRGLFHGTHVSATAVGALDNGQGTAGIAPRCTLMPISVGEQITSMRILDAILYAINQGASVVNLSLGNYYSDEVTESSASDQLDYALHEGKYVEDIWDYVFKLADERNCTIVWAGGNQGIITGMDESKRNGSTVRVSAVDRNLRRPEFSNYGRFDNMGVNYSDVSAPGVQIYNAGPGNNYGFSDGTSMAAPIVTGAIALMKSINPNLTNKEVVEILQSTSRQLPASDHAGGLLQIRDALDRVRSSVANFDEIKDDPSKIVGDWMTTEMHDVSDSSTGQHLGKTHILLHFDSPQRGRITYKEASGHNYVATVECVISDNGIKVMQRSPAEASGKSDSYEPMEFVGRRGAGGMLECRRSQGAPFYLVRQ